MIDIAQVSRLDFIVITAMRYRLYWDWLSGVRALMYERRL